MFSTLALLSSLALVRPAIAQEGAGGMYSFFGGRDIDYWAEGRLVHDALKQGPIPPEKGVEATTAPLGTSFSGATIVRAGDAKPFTWGAYRDPRGVEFWDDGGDWIPPRPFREAAAQPTARNVDEYLKWQARKAEVLGKFQAVLSQRGRVMLEVLEPTKTAAVTNAATRAAVPWQDIKIAYFYQTSCPHCRASKETIEEAHRLGAQVTFIQLDHLRSPPMHMPSVPYDQGWENAFRVTSTPTWVLSVGGKTFKHTGALGLPELTHFAELLIAKESTHEQLSR